MQGLCWDTRIGDPPRWALCDDSELMQVSDELRKCVCFIKVRGNGWSAHGTAFFVADPLGVAD